LRSGREGTAASRHCFALFYRFGGRFTALLGPPHRLNTVQKHCARREAKSPTFPVFPSFLRLFPLAFPCERTLELPRHKSEYRPSEQPHNSPYRAAISLAIFPHFRLFPSFPFSRPLHPSKHSRHRLAQWSMLPRRRPLRRGGRTVTCCTKSVLLFLLSLPLLHFHPSLPLKADLPPTPSPTDLPRYVQGRQRRRTGRPSRYHQQAPSPRFSRN